MWREGRRGFTLIELMVVVTIIAVVAAIAIPSLLNARKSANEAAAVSALRTLTTVSAQYRTRYGTYANDLTDLEGAAYIDEVLGSGSRSGYDFFYAGVINAWVCLANPREVGTTGDRYFFVDQSGVIRFNTTVPAGSGDAPIQ